MFDFHMHSRVSFDGRDTGLNMARAAVKAGLQQICFTDHMDYDPANTAQTMCFDLTAYQKEYEIGPAPGLEIYRGVEFGLLPDNREQIHEDIRKYPYDFAIGSLHFIDNLDVYFREYWEGKTYEWAILHYLEEMLSCVKLHDNFDVLGHITYLGKAGANPVKQPIRYQDYREVVDEIFKVLVAKGKGIEVNTSGMDRCGAFLPDAEYLRRFKELGGEIVTVGSDAHHSDRVGQYCREAAELVEETFGYVCTFAGRKPRFHTL